MTKYGLLDGIRWSVFISKSQRILYVLFFRADSGLYKYHLIVCSNFNFLRNSQWITLSTQSCLVLYSFCTSLLLSFIMWLRFSFPSPHNLHLLFCPRGVMVKGLDCGIVLQLCYYVYFRTNTLGKGMSPLILPAMS